MQAMHIYGNLPGDHQEPVWTPRNSTSDSSRPQKHENTYVPEDTELARAAHTRKHDVELTGTGNTSRTPDLESSPVTKQELNPPDRATSKAWHDILGFWRRKEAGVSTSPGKVEDTIMISEPDDHSEMIVYVKLPDGTKRKLLCKRSDRIGLLFFKLDVAGLDMDSHIMHRDGDSSELIDYLRFQDETIFSGQVLVVETRSESGKVHDVPNDNAEIEVILKLPHHKETKRELPDENKRKVKCKRSDRIGLLSLKREAGGWDTDEYRMRKKHNSAELVDHLRLQDEGILNGQVIIVEPRQETLSDPHEPKDTTTLTVIVKLPNGNESHFTFKKSDRVGLLFVKLEARGWDMDRHLIRGEFDSAELTDYLRFQDECIRNGQWLVLEPRSVVC